MEKIYIDNLNHCHRINDGTMTAVETSAFIGKCDAFVEGHCYDTSKGYAQIYPWKPYGELAAAQAQYELMMAEAAEAYQRGINSI